MNIKPLGDRIVVEPVKEEEVTKSGIVLPETAEKEKKQEGLVVAVGPGKLSEDGKRVPMDVAVGERVLFKKWGGDEVSVGGVDYKIISQDDVLGILN